MTALIKIQYFYMRVLRVMKVSVSVGLLPDGQAILRDSILRAYRIGSSRWN
jgi:hypothetical protein